MTVPKDVVFIGGYGRSGSTLLDRILGHSSTSFFSGGELRHVFAEGYLENRLCGCGASFGKCEFWSEVTERAFGGLDEEAVNDILRLKGRVDRWWLTPFLAIPALRWARLQKDVGHYVAILGRLYEAIFDASGCDVVIDSTKDPSHGYVLATTPGVRLHVVHLVRDSRAVAFSWQRKKFHPGNRRDMNRYSLAKTGTEWNAINALVRALRHRADSYQVLRYEDFVHDPSAAVEGIVEKAGLRPPDLSLPRNGSIDLGNDHTVAGNPIRFQRGATSLRLDDEWRRSMPARSRALMTTLTLPSLGRYGFGAG